MKLFSLFFFLLFFNTLIFAQAKTEPFKNANTILIETGLTGSAAFTIWGKHLGQNGFSISKSDATFLTLTTGLKDTKKLNVEYYLICAVTDSGVIKIQIKWRIPPSILFKSQGSEFFEWEYSSSKATTTNSIFVDMQKIISSFGQYKVVYQKD